MAEIEMLANCKNCNKYSVCRYTEDVIQKANEIEELLKEWKLPMKAIIKCNEHRGDGIRTI